eukprot:949600-Prymnesium_polylepis.1
MGASSSQPSAPTAPSDADPRKARWRQAFTSCTPTLEALALAQDEPGRLAARTWWVVCMASQCGGCDDVYG